MTSHFDGKVALVTAAAAGIGAATAEAFARAGAHVVLADIDEASGESVAERIRLNGGLARFVRTDCTEEDEIKRLVEKTVDLFGRLDVAVNVVGTAHPGAAGPIFHTQTLAAWNWTVTVSLNSVFLGMKHQIAHMIDNGGGSIVNVSSLSGMLYNPEGGAAYAASKAGVIQLSKFAALTYADRNIRVNCIAPGVTLSSAFDSFGPGADEVLNKLIDKQAIKRGIEPEEQAEGIIWLCSGAAAMVTGIVLPIDGGWSAR